MKRLLILLLMSGLMSGCVKVKTIDEDCIDPAAYPESVILQTLPQPCRIHNALVTIAKTGVILDEVQYGELEAKLDQWIGELQVAEAVAAGNVKDVLASFLVRYNHKVGLAFIVISDMFLEFDDSVTFAGDDIRVLILCMEDIKKQAKSISVLAQ